MIVILIGKIGVSKFFKINASRYLIVLKYWLIFINGGEEERLCVWLLPKKYFSKQVLNDNRVKNMHNFDTLFIHNKQSQTQNSRGDKEGLEDSILVSEMTGCDTYCVLKCYNLLIEERKLSRVLPT